MQKTVITISGIRPDFIRMSEIFKKLDENFNHILIHSGQHYDKLMSGVFFDELDIRKPDYNLGVGGKGKEHFHQIGELSTKIIELIREKDLKPDIILFLGDSNSVVCSVPLKKEGYRIGHIEAGMRSGDKRMLEEINRTVCDVCSDLLFVYHENYKKKLEKENITEGIHVVGNTIVEVVNKQLNSMVKPKETGILLDIHRPENFNYKNRLKNILEYANMCGYKEQLPVYMLKFPRTMKKINEFNLELGENIIPIDLLSFKSYLNAVSSSKYIISDSGTAQEEPALLKTKVIVPRDFTERPESVENNCSFMLDVNSKFNDTWFKSVGYVSSFNIPTNALYTDWLGDGTTSDKIIEILKNEL